MKNRGYITVFVSLLLMVLVVVYLVFFKIVDIAAARSKSGVALSTACSSVKAEKKRLHVILKSLWKRISEIVTV